MSKVYRITLLKEGRQEQVFVESSMNREMAVISIARKYHALAIDVREIRWKNVPDNMIVELLG